MLADGQIITGKSAMSDNYIYEGPLGRQIRALEDVEAMRLDRLAKLCDDLDVVHGSADWEKKALLAMAERHVPGFQEQLIRVGRPAHVKTEDQLELRMYVNLCLEHLKENKQRPTRKAIFEELHKEQYLGVDDTGRPRKNPFRGIEVNTL